MAHVNTYLNFARNTEEAFLFYQSVFGGEFTGGEITRFSDIPATEGMPSFSDEEKNLVMHIELPILGGHVLMATDAPESMGFTMNFGNNVHIMLELDTRADADKYFTALSERGQTTMAMQDMFWGSYYGSCTDRFGVQWMFSFTEKQKDGTK